MSAPAHVRAPLHASTDGVHFGVDIRDASGMLVGCVFGLADVMMPTARAMATGPQLLAAAQKLAERGFFTAVSCASREELEEMAEMRAAIAAATAEVKKGGTV